MRKQLWHHLAPTDFFHAFQFSVRSGYGNQTLLVSLLCALLGKGQMFMMIFFTSVSTQSGVDSHTDLGRTNTLVASFWEISEGDILQLLICPKDPFM